jgi:hypothetical protein
MKKSIVPLAFVLLALSLSGCYGPAFGPAHYPHPNNGPGYVAETPQTPGY